MNAMITLVVLSISLLSNFAKAQDPATLCALSERPNIDCACVEKRLEVFTGIAPNETSRRLVEEGYRAAHGAPNDYQALSEETYEDVSFALLEADAFDSVGGRPGNIEEYEGRCVIPNTPPADFRAPRMSPIMESYLTSCTASVGKPRTCACMAAQEQAVLTDDEFEAFYRSFADFSDQDALTNAEMSAARAKAMGISIEQYQSLSSQARKKLALRDEASLRYCTVRLWADDWPGTPAALRATGGFDEVVLAALKTTAASTSDPEPELAGGPLDMAREIIRRNCPAAGNTESYCSCYLDEFNLRVVSKARHEGVVLAWASLFSPFSGTTAGDLEFMSSLPKEDMEAAGLMMMQTADVGDNCSQE